MSKIFDTRQLKIQRDFYKIWFTPSFPQVSRCNREEEKFVSKKDERIDIDEGIFIKNLNKIPGLVDKINEGINQRFFHFNFHDKGKATETIVSIRSIDRIVSKETGSDRKPLNFSRGSSMTFDATNLFTRRSSGRKREPSKETREK